MPSIMQPRISIITPFKNAAPWIEETILSIQKQSFSDWEMILINDHSTDNGAQIVTKIQKADSRITLIQNKDEGIIPALQLGISISKGEFITRMDADDLMPENRLQLMLDSILSSESKTVVTGKVKYFGNEPISDGYLAYEKWLNDRVEKNDFYNQIYRECVIASPNWLVKKQDIMEDQIFSKLHYPEDYDMVFQWRENGYNIEAIEEVTLFWREHPKRTSRNSEIYQQDSFFKLKIDWFLRSESTNNLVLLGAGTKGKKVAKQLIEKNIEFKWHDFQFEKYGAPIFGQQIRNYKEIIGEQLLIAVYPPHLEEFIQFINQKGFDIGKNAWFL